MKICVINALKFIIFDFFKKYFLNLRSLKSVPETLVNETLYFIYHGFGKVVNDLDS